MLSTREYGDSRVLYYVNRLKKLGVDINITNNSGAARGNCDAVMAQGLIAIEGKTSFTNSDITCARDDFIKAFEQAKDHSRSAALLVENKLYKAAVFMSVVDFKALFPKANLHTYTYSSKSKNWEHINDIEFQHYFGEDTIEANYIFLITNNLNETVCSVPWATFEDLMEEHYSIQTEEPNGSTKKDSNRRSRKFSTNKRKLNSKRKFASKSSFKNK